MRAQAFRLTPPVPLLELRRPVAHEQAMTLAMREAMKAALAGDFSELDRLELEYLNVLVRIGELTMKDRNGTPHWWFERQWTEDDCAPFVVEIHRGFGPRGETALEWAIGEKCRRCAGLLRHVACHVCEGKWHLIDVADEAIYTDVDGFVLEER